jgi:pyruvate-formate lyase
MAVDSYVPLRNSTAPAKVFTPKARPPTVSAMPKSFSPPRRRSSVSTNSTSSRVSTTDHLGVARKLFSLMGKPKAEVRSEMTATFPELTPDELDTLMRQTQASWLVVSSKLSSIALSADDANWRAQLAPVLEALTDLNV